jgi:hypothetical protein
MLKLSAVGKRDLIFIYSETSPNRSAMGPIKVTGLEGWTVLGDFLGKDCSAGT